MASKNNLTSKVTISRLDCSNHSNFKFFFPFCMQKEEDLSEDLKVL
uniref:Uncharacterized protein n=1 Tax=Anguilla anguilla TaxID=7936 RepID=A0A0E9R3I1_ANGAN